MTNRIIILPLLLLVACSQSFYGQGKKLAGQERYEEAIENFYKEISSNPQSADAWRELGIAYYKSGDMQKATESLQQAQAIAPGARAYLFLGLIAENGEDYQGAIDAYADALQLNPSGKTKNTIRAHLDRLIHHKIAKEVATALENESAIDAESVPENSVAVVNFDGSNLDPEFAPIAIGLAEFASADLAKVKSLNVVERLKIDIIMEELKLGQQGFVDPATAPRVGRLLGARKIVTGSIVGIGGDNFRLDGALINTFDSTTRFAEPAEGDIRKLFEVEKKLVFSLITELGVKLTAEERDAIREVPTESYLAFLSYCRGLDYQRRGMTQPAEQEFNNALNFDANFGAADRALQKAAAGDMAAGYGQSVQTVEALALSSQQLEAVVSGLDETLSNVVFNRGVIPAEWGRNPARSQPRLTGSGSVLIRVDFDYAD